MKTNTYKKPPRKPVSYKFNGWLQSKLHISIAAENTNTVDYLPYFLFITVLGILYIGNTFRAEKLNTEINKLHRNVEVLRVEYQTLKYDFMLQSRRAEIEKRVRPLGLKDFKELPIIIED
ncbi:FtsL-like putative cell division protein [Algivirga pacifica]|uniref:S-adenosyl-methyltransferase n=1 Tax=Algivirga pacifica TaxID=1162670 RepID=A0ABP9D2T8_9BACT